MSLYQLPLHLCSMAGVFVLFHAFFKWDWLGQVSTPLCLPGTVLALLFPDWVRYPAIHFITIQGFTFHAGIVLYVICQLLQHNIIPRLAALWKVIVFLLVVVPPVYLFDKKFHANYMFVNVPSPGSPLEWLASFLGNPGYLAGYAVLMLLCMCSWTPVTGCCLTGKAAERRIKRKREKRYGYCRRRIAAMGCAEMRSIWQILHFQH